MPILVKHNPVPKSTLFLNIKIYFHIIFLLIDMKMDCKKFNNKKLSNWKSINK